MNRPLVPKDFYEYRQEGVLHGWKYENDQYTVDINMCWNGCDIKVIFKKGKLGDGYEHIAKSEPSFSDQDVMTALAASNAILLAQKYGFGK